MSKQRAAAHEALVAFALDLPGAWPDEPWDGDAVAKVGKKIFVFFGHPDEPRVTVKLPETADVALSVPGAAPTGYGLGRAGWVTLPVVGKGVPEVGVFEDWIEESYRAVAPKKLVAELDRRTE